MDTIGDKVLEKLSKASSEVSKVLAGLGQSGSMPHSDAVALLRTARKRLTKTIDLLDDGDDE